MASQEEIQRVIRTWEADVREKRDGHAQVLRQLHEEGLEPDKFLDTTAELDKLKAAVPRLARLQESLSKLHLERTELLDRVGEYERKRVEHLHDAVRAANQATGGVVVVRPIAAPDRSHINDLFREFIPAPRQQVGAAVGAQDFSPRAFVTAARQGTAELARYGVRGAQAASVIQAGERLFRRLEELSVGHAVEVLLDVSTSKTTRELKVITSLSKGQRATALLLLLLGASNAPLVIDQPEDDLDNRFVYDGLVAHLRKLKGIRQIIASTHNANVPVLGDAELIVAMEGDGQHGRPALDGIGSLDDGPIRALAERILEGGAAAFNARRHLYGF